MTKKTVRLLMPQWQGGNNPHYSFGAELLAWLAPKIISLLLKSRYKLLTGIRLKRRMA